MVGFDWRLNRRFRGTHLTLEYLSDHRSSVIKRAGMPKHLYAIPMRYRNQKSLATGLGRIIRLSQIKLAQGRLSTLLTNFPLLNSKGMGELRTSIYITV